MRVKHSMATVLLTGLLLAAASGPGPATVPGPATSGSTAVIDRVVDATTAVILVETVGRELHLPVSSLHLEPSPGTWLYLWPPAGPIIDRPKTEQRRADLRTRQEALLDRSDPRRWTRGTRPGSGSAYTAREAPDAASAYSRPSLAASATAPARLRTPSLS